MISKTGLHAIKALAALAELPEGIHAGAGAIAARIGAPPNYLGKMLQNLTRAKLVISQKGLGGGFRLARDPRQISLFDIIEPIEHVSRWSGCFLGHGPCDEAAPCALHHRWSQVRDAYIQLLQETSVADLVSRPELLVAVDHAEEIAG